MRDEQRRPIRLVIVEDNLGVQKMFWSLLEPHRHEIEVLGATDNAQDALKLVQRRAPDVVLMDLKIPQQGYRLDEKSCRFGITAIGTITRLAAPPRVLAVSHRDTAPGELIVLYEVQRLDVGGYLAKSDDFDSVELREAIFRVARGEKYYSRLVRRAFEALRTLSPQEQRVFELLARRASDEEIGAALVIARSTVKSHVSNVLNKLELRSREDIPPRHDDLFFAEVRR